MPWPPPGVVAFPHHFLMAAHNNPKKRKGAPDESCDGSHEELRRKTRPNHRTHIDITLHIVIEPGESQRVASSAATDKESSLCTIGLEETESGPVTSCFIKMVCRKLNSKYTGS